MDCPRRNHLEPSSTEEGRRVYVCAVAVGMDLTDHDELEMRTSPTREATQDGQVGA
jgi:hypothetical protein